MVLIDLDDHSGHRKHQAYILTHTPEYPSYPKVDSKPNIVNQLTNDLYYYVFSSPNLCQIYDKVSGKMIVLGIGIQCTTAHVAKGNWRDPKKNNKIIDDITFCIIESTNHMCPTSSSIHMFP